MIQLYNSAANVKIQLLSAAVLFWARMMYGNAMDIIALMASGRGYRGCLFDGDGYHFFQYSRKGALRKLKRYPAAEFEDHDHFTAMMMKYMIPSAFLRPPVAIDQLNLAELDRVHALLKQRISSEVG